MSKGEKGIRDWYNQDYAPWQRKVAEMKSLQEEQMTKVRGHLPELQVLVGMLLDGKTKQAVDLWNRLGIHPALRGITIANGGNTLTVEDVAGSVQELSVDEVVLAIERLR